MIAFIAVFALVCMWQIQLRPVGNDNYIKDYMSINKTTAVKGIFIIIVFFSHFNSYVDFTNSYDLAYDSVYGQIGQRMVTLFMFYSGYGVMEAISKKKTAYINKIPVTRVLGTLFRFDIAVLCYLLLNIIINRGAYKITPKSFILSLVGWQSIGNSNWYIFAIVICYIATFIGFEIFRDKLKYIPSALAVTGLLLAYVSFFHFYELNATRFYNTVLCYPLGIFYSLYRDKLERLINKSNTLWAVLFAGSVIAAKITYDHRGDRFFIYELSMFAFVAAVVLFTMQCSLNNKILRFCGQHLFGIYIMQRIPMTVFQRLGLSDFNIYIYFIVCLVTTILIAYLFDKYVGMLWNLIIKPKSRQKSN